MKRITYRWLKKKRACEEQLILFKERYPNGIEVCWECFREAQKKGLDVCWLLDRLQNDVQSEVYSDRIDYKRFPKLEERFNMCDWTIEQFSAKQLQIIEAAILKNQWYTPKPE